LQLFDPLIALTKHLHKLLFAHVLHGPFCKQDAGLNQRFFRGAFSFSALIPRTHFRSV
jgi:hypothetical protein